MQKIKDTLLDHFRKNGKIIDDVIFIIISYSTPYFEQSSINFSFENKYVTLVKNIYGDKCAIGYSDGSISICNQLCKTIITKGPHEECSGSLTCDKHLIVSICEFGVDEIIYKYNDTHACFVWNWKTNVSKFITDLICVNNIINFNEKILVCNNYKNNIFVNGFKPYLTKDYPYNGLSCICSFDNNILIGSCANKISKIIMTDINKFIHTSSEYQTVYCEEKDKTYCSIQLYPCNENNSAKKTNNILIIESFNDADDRINNIITVCNIVNKIKMNVIKNIIGKITSLVYLKNGYFAMSLDGDIMIYHIQTKSLVQIIKDYNKFIRLEVLNGQLIAVSDNHTTKVFI